ncbi:penicillin-binding protein, transpeptidase domain protein [Aeromicrobium marinum DSM 15272]|uniref:Penicillin-binding protein, transpeptidase domain protein n=1 Tax=Aeromicrobium marinum DSM 15272 TaxID=585531 RepID=E2S8T9_9ACTN|nr:penicillin-binding transpeptidase domain-containing protein [Aeromicrobium marinum]EFQ84594.1 penicillin-binding protein, transpeptidase domain protein [Aeromicrobium marinum DSM 15272]
MNAPIRNLAIACLALFVALLVNITVVQFVQAGDLNDRNGNRRVIDEEFSRERGPILVGGEPIAQSVPSDDRFRFQRQYPEGPLYAPITGYFSYVHGNTAVERAQNGVLSGSDNRLFVNRVVDLLANNQPQGGSVELTINALAQRTAAAGLEALGAGTKGAVAAIDPETGAILAMVTQPSYDPNALASHDLGFVDDTMQALLADENDPLINRAADQILPPGSTFKLVTAAAAIDQLGLTPDSEVRGGALLPFPGITYQLPNEGGGDCGGDPITFQRALSVSCNVSFGDLAGQIGQEALAEQAAKFGFGDDILDGLASTASRFTPPDTTLEAPQLAQSGIGQFEVAATPLQMAMVAAGIANDGVVMEPYLVDTVRAPNLRVLEEAEPTEYAEALTPDQARVLQAMMVDVVENGTGASARIGGVQVGGKTGTAQSTPDRPPYAWFVSYAKAGDQQVAVAVVVESSSTGRDEIAGGRLAGPIARSVMQAVLGL